jgi:hypothetical protein
MFQKKGERCACADDLNSGEPQPGCRRCGGTGYVQHPKRGTGPTFNRRRGEPKQIRQLSKILTWPETNMVVLATDRDTGRFYRCPCGWCGWTVWGHARKHHEQCKQAHAGNTNGRRRNRHG